MTKPIDDTCMFPGTAFATPFFIEYGQNGQTSAVDEADRYIYACATDGFWDNGDRMTLGRVPRERLARLRADDWEFVTEILDGVPQWTTGKAGLAATASILEAPGKLGQCGIIYHAASGRYLLPQWHYPDLLTLGTTVPGVQQCNWEWYEAPHPWGPWTLFFQHTWTELGLYNPSLPLAYASADGTTCWALATGNFMTYDQPPETTQYSLYLIPITLNFADET